MSKTVTANGQKTADPTHTVGPEAEVKLKDSAGGMRKVLVMELEPSQWEFIVTELRKDDPGTYADAAKSINTALDRIKTGRGYDVVIVRDEMLGTDMDKDPAKAKQIIEEMRDAGARKVIVTRPTLPSVDLGADDYATRPLTTKNIQDLLAKVRSLEKGRLTN